MPLGFGTDGLRGLAGTELTPEVALALGRAAASTLGGTRFLVGRDTRASGPMLQAALSAGLAAAGADVVDLGVLPTPGVAFHASAHGLPAAVVSASHNPFPDNGIKLFGPGGRKLGDDAERSIEERLGAELAAGPEPRPDGRTGDLVGRLEQGGRAAIDAYVDHLIGALEGRRLDGLRVVLDCANGAASEVAPEAFRRAGAWVHVLNAAPDGLNINDGCGSTHPADLQAAVREHDADAGLAFDGDADRVVAVDHDGRVVDGDAIIAICARDLHERGRLVGGAVVVTVMSNLGFHRAMADAGIRVVAVRVGDRYVLEALDSEGLVLGGEQSGHIVFRDLATTGDGALTGLLLLDVVARTGRHLDELADSSMTRFPQVLRNVRVARRDDLDRSDAVWAAVREEEAALGADGRVLLRASGTEPLVRVMVEAPTDDVAEASAARLAAVVADQLGEGATAAAGA